MPHYFFFLESSEGFTEDKEGENLVDDAAAHEAALVTARELGGWHRHGGGESLLKTQAAGSLLSAFKSGVQLRFEHTLIMSTHSCIALALHCFDIENLDVAAPVFDPARGLKSTGNQ